MPMPKFTFSFVSNKRKQVALFDASGLSLLSKFIDQRDISIIDVEQMNVFAALRMLASGKKSFFDYTVAYLKIFKPRFVFTFIDNNVDFYKIASLFPEIKFIAIQNGLRANYANQSGGGFFDVLKREALNSELSAHAICVFGKSSGDLFKRFIRTEPIIIGSLKNNLIGDDVLSTKKFDIVLISQHSPFEIPNSETSFYFGDQPFTAAEFYFIEQRVVRFLAERAIRTNQSFAVLGKRTDSSPFEREFFASAAKPNPVQFFARTSESSTYEFCQSASLIVSVDSAVGYEFLARGKKVVFLSGRINAISPELSSKIHDTDFGFPLELGASGPFWTNTANESEFEQIIESVQTMSDEQWATAISPYNDVLMAYQPGNTGFIRLLQNEGIPLINEGSQHA
jgi:surface carbohydrate biosynthesis protein